MSSPTWETLSLDQSLALRHAANRLAGEFDGMFGVETIERFLHSSLRPVRRPGHGRASSCR